ncbi:cofactor-independent phosphoglycerate mutase [bacterium]|nr:cofactor-independent phosphoglycerate mutase [bacterium]
MKYIVILGDGMADVPVKKLNGKTPLQVANKPNMDRIAREGRCGLFRTVPADLPPGSEVANLGVMGFDARTCGYGRGALEAASMGVEIGDDDMAMRCNVLCIENKRIKNHSAGHITSAESDELLGVLRAEVGGHGLSFYTGVDYRHLFVGHGLSPDLICMPPHDHPGELVEDLMIKPKNSQAKATAELLNRITRRSWELFEHHPLNERRRAEGKDPANSIWLWSPGRRPTMWTYKDRFGVTGAVISAVDLIRGIGVYAGLDVIKVEGATGLWNTNFEGKADACLNALKDHDFVYLHVEAPDEASHEGNLERKIKSIEDLDRRLIGRILGELEKKHERAVVALLPDHPTPVESRVHIHGDVPFAIMSPGIEADSVERYDEAACAKGGYGLLEGDQFIKTVLGKE